MRDSNTSFQPADVINLRSQGIKDTMDHKNVQIQKYESLKF
jgi:hypothetical protein